MYNETPPKEKTMKIVAPTLVERIVVNIKFRIALAKASYNTHKSLTK